MFPAKQTLRIRHIKVISNKKLVQEVVYNNLKIETCTQITLGAPGHEVEVRMALKRGLTHLVNLLNFPIVELHEWKNINDFIGELMWPTDQKGEEIHSMMNVAVDCCTSLHAVANGGYGLKIRSIEHLDG